MIEMDDNAKRRFGETVRSAEDLKVTRTWDYKEVIPELRRERLSESYTPEQRHFGTDSVVAYRETIRIEGKEPITREGFAFKSEVEGKCNKLRPLPDRSFIFMRDDRFALDNRVTLEPSYLMLKDSHAIDEWAKLSFSGDRTAQEDKAREFLEKYTTDKPYTYATQHPDSFQIVLADQNCWCEEKNGKEVFRHMDLHDITGELYETADEKGRLYLHGSGERDVDFSRMDTRDNHKTVYYEMVQDLSYVQVSEKPELSVFRETYREKEGRLLYCGEGIIETEQMKERTEGNAVHGIIEPFDDRSPRQYMAVDGRALSDFFSSHMYDYQTPEAGTEFLDKSVLDQPFTEIESTRIEQGKDPDIAIVQVNTDFLREAKDAQFILYYPDGNEIGLEYVADEETIGIPSRDAERDDTDFQEPDSPENDREGVAEEKEADFEEER